MRPRNGVVEVKHYKVRKLLMQRQSHEIVKFKKKNKNKEREKKVFKYVASASYA